MASVKCQHCGEPGEQVTTPTGQLQVSACYGCRNRHTEARATLQTAQEAIDHAGAPAHYQDKGRGMRTVEEIQKATEWHICDGTGEYPDPDSPAGDGRATCPGCRKCGDESDDTAERYIGQLEGAYRQARAALLTIAGGVPRMDQWTSAASFMESTADVLDTFKVERPDHYDGGEF